MLDISRIQESLSSVLNASVTVTADDRIEPWFVHRLRLHATGPGVPDTVIVKSLRAHPAGFRTDPAQVLTEAAALEFLAGRSLPVAPQLIVRVEDMLILEDLSPCRPLNHLLLERGELAMVESLRAFARTIAELHGGTVGHSDAYNECRRRLGPDQQPERYQALAKHCRESFTRIEKLGVELSSGAEADFTRMLEVLGEPGPFFALSNGDMAANNFLVRESDDSVDGWIIDFEFAGYGHALADICSFYVPSPAFMTAGNAVSTGVESTYRATLASAVPAVDDDMSFGLGLTAAALAMAIERVHRWPALEARAPGHESRRQIVSTLESAARVAESHRALPQLGGWVRRVAETLRARWPDADVDFATYPSYAERR